MVLTPSTMLPLNTPAPDFRLPDTRGKMVSLADFHDAPALLVVFMCVHCPYVRHIQYQLAQTVREYQAQGLAAVGINANDIVSHPDDRPQKMAEQAETVGFTFPYLFDESQQTAKDFHAACTPDFFLFDGDRKLAYRGRFDDSRPDNAKPITAEFLRKALDAVLAGQSVTVKQKPSIGCNIKWKPGNEPDYF